MLVRLSIVLALLIVVLVGPFLLQPDPETGGVSIQGAERLVIITPHNESIQTEFAQAFARHMKDKHDKEIFVDWRQPGGTSEIARFLKSEYAARFENLWKQTTGLPFTSAVQNGFQNSKIKMDPENQQGLLDDLPLLGRASPDERATAARALFLQSRIGVGVDLFFGGGAYDFSKQAAAGSLVSIDASGQFGPEAVKRDHPEWFEDSIMPESVSGEPFRDSQFRWLGTVLSSFGICYNRDVLERLGLDRELEKWDDLSNPRLAGQIALADPTKSGSTTKAFEMLIQERIQRLLTAGVPEDEAVSTGWNEAMQQILKISANARYFTDSAAKVPRDVALGDAAAGMCIDFYGRTFNELYQDENGDSHVQFVMPKAGTSIGADPIGMLRGAPNPELAHRFIEFVLSTKGQKLWNFRPGSPGGPSRFALRRPPIRKDFYTETNVTHMTDPEVNPYEIARGFTYNPEWTGSLFSSLRFVIKCACIDPHEEQKAAWEALIEAGMPEEELRQFEDVSLISYESVLSNIAPALSKREKVTEVKLARELSREFRDRYHRIARKFGDERK